MKLIVITAEIFFEGEAEAVNLLFENGLEVLHIRKPYASQRETELFIGQINKNFHSRIVIHDYYGLTKLFDLKGIHLNRRNQETDVELPKICHNRHCPSLRGTKQSIRKQHHCEKTVFLEATLCETANEGFSISRSCHSLDEVSESRFYDYVFLSPIFDSISKEGYKQGFTSEQLNKAKVRKIIDGRVIALGGITAENIFMANSYGFGGVAVLGDLWSGFAVGRNVNALLKRFSEMKFKCNMV